MNCPYESADDAAEDEFWMCQECDASDMECPVHQEADENLMW